MSIVSSSLFGNNSITKLELARLCQLQREFSDMYRRFDVCGISLNGVQIQASGMADFAPLSNWTLNVDRGDDTFPFEHFIVIDGVKFHCISVNPIVPDPASEGGQ
jgi:hypothetical protein